MFRWKKIEIKKKKNVKIKNCFNTAHGNTLKYYWENIINLSCIIFDSKNFYDWNDLAHFNFKFHKNYFSDTETDCYWIFIGYFYTKMLIFKFLYELIFVVKAKKVRKPWFWNTAAAAVTYLRTERCFKYLLSLYIFKIVVVFI